MQWKEVQGILLLPLKVKSFGSQPNNQPETNDANMPMAGWLLITYSN